MAQSFNTNLSKIAIAYLRKMNVPVSESSFQKRLEENAFYPSLYSVSKTFEKFNIENTGLRIEEEELKELPLPFLAYLSNQSNGSDFVMVSGLTDTTVSYLGDDNKTFSVGREAFLKDWTNIVFVAEANEKSGEENYEKIRKTEALSAVKQNGLMLGAVFIILTAVYSLFESSQGILSITTILLTKSIGIITTILLLIYDIDKSNTIVKNICTGGKQTNCDAVLNSSANKIFGMNWSDVGFFYFAATTFFLLFPGIPFLNKLPWIALAGSMVAPYVLFSIYYQWKVVKQWCPLCLTVQVILAMEFIWGAVYYWTSPSLPDFQYIAPIFVSILLPIIVWYTIKPILLKANNGKGFESEYKRLVNNPAIFDLLLQQQEVVPDGWQNLGIIVGNPDAEHTIVKVCSPYCGPCAKAHPVLEEIINTNPNIKLRVIFTAQNNESDRNSIVVKHFLAIAEKGNAQKALDDWYLAENKDYNSFAGLYPMNGELKKQGDKVAAMRKWCDETGISYTPTIFFNGKKLPDIYELAELKDVLN